MKFSESLKKNQDFRIVYAKGKSYGGKYFLMYLLNNSQDNNRLGISVSKKVGNSVVRHRVTRLVREAYRLQEELFFKGGESFCYDIVIVARAASKNVTYKETEQEILHLFECILMKAGKMN